MNSDPVIALLTESGKRLQLPRRILGMVERMAADPAKKYGNNRSEVIRHALCGMKNGVERHDREEKERAEEAARIEALKTEPGYVAPREPERMAAEMEPAALAELDAALAGALDLAIPEAARGGDLWFLLTHRLSVVSKRRAQRKEAA